MIYCTSTSSQTSSSKYATVQVSSGETVNFSLYVGVTVTVKFTYGNTASSPQLNVQNTGYKPIRCNNQPYAYWTSGMAITFTYDGTYWNCSSIPVYANEAIIGNQNGYNVYLDGSGVNFRNGSTNLAEFSADGINLQDFWIQKDPVLNRVSIGGSNVQVGFSPPGQSGYSANSVELRDIVYTGAAAYVQVYGDIESTATNSWKQGQFYIGANNIYTYVASNLSVASVDNSRRIDLPYPGVYEVFVYGLVYSCSAGDLCHFGLGTSTSDMLVDIQNCMAGNWGSITGMALIKVPSSGIVLYPYYKCEQGYGSILSGHSKVLIRFVGASLD